MATVSMKEVLQKLDGAGVEDVRALRDALNQVVAKVDGSRQPQAPCDVRHVYSDNRTNAAGKVVPRSCVICGSRDVHAGEAHGDLVATTAVVEAK